MMQDETYQYNFVPTLMKRVDGNVFVHPRKKIKDCDFLEGERLEVWVKDRSKEASYDEDKWYAQAFGPERNIMTVKVTYMPEEDKWKKASHLKLIGTFKYNMAPELREEFDESKFEKEWELEMPKMLKDGVEVDINWYEHEFDLPYGRFDYTFKLLYGSKETEKKLEKDAVQVELEPIPVMAAEQLKADLEEEKLNIERQAEAKRKRRELEEKKAQEAFEKQQQILQQEQNTLKLDTYWMVMNLNFHASEKDANASLAVLSVYLDTLLDYFSFYASLQP